ncbi:Potassium transporter 19 [Capsicum chinense]|nr:Potassium transporter 19 [Capsicum chinense]
MSGNEQNQDVLQQRFKGKKRPSEKLNRYDSLDLESKVPEGKKALEWSMILKLAFQSIGVVYGDIGTSPLFVFSIIFPNGIKVEEDILGALSMIFYIITLIPLIKYVFIVLQANDKGDDETKSTSGYVFTLGGGAVSWRSAKQTVIARSTMESEFMNLELAGTKAE